jgi:hypothetical protein
MTVISSVRWHAALAAGAAVAAVLALAGPAGASTGPAQISPEQAGYTATGAQFKTIVATVYLRQPAQYASEAANLAHSIQLWSPGLVLTLGVTASTSGVGYTPYATIYDRSTHEVIASNPDALYCNPNGICGPSPIALQPGFTVLLTIRYSPRDGSLIMNGDSTDRSTFGFSTRPFADIPGPQSFTQARVGTEFGSSPWDASYQHAPPSSYLKIASYHNVSLTTYSGHTSALWSWWVHHKLLANTGQQSGSDWVAVPSDLSSGGASFQTRFVPRSAQSSSQPVAP